MLNPVPSDIIRVLITELADLANDHEHTAEVVRIADAEDEKAYAAGYRGCAERLRAITPALGPSDAGALTQLRDNLLEEAAKAESLANRGQGDDRLRENARIRAEVLRAVAERITSLGGGRG